MLVSGGPVSTTPVSSLDAPLTFFDAARGIVLNMAASTTRFVFAAANVIYALPAWITWFSFRDRREER